MNINNFGLLNSLYGIVNNGEQDNDYAVATFILHNIHRIQEISINEVIDESFTTRSAVRRFCHRIGYDNFSEFKQSFSKLVFPSNLTFRHFLPIEDYRQSRHNEIQQMLDDLDQQISNETVVEIVSLISQYKKVVLVCANNTSGDLIRFQQELLFVEKIVFVISDVYEDNNLLNNVDEETLVIVVSASGTFASEADKWIQSLSSYKVLITGNQNLNFQQTYQKIYLLSQQHIDNDYSGVYGKYGITYLFDLIAESYFYQLQKGK